MKRQTLAIGLFLLVMVTGLACALQTQAQRQATTGKALQAAAANYTVSGPYSHKNLTIFLIHGADQMKGKVPLTLQEALEQKKVIVHETGDVNELAIENVSPEEVYVQSGDIVKGGRQDRVLALDLIVPPKSGRMPIESFCVEHGRWTRRGEEAAGFFNSSSNALASKDLKMAAKAKRSQQEVWDNVAVAQDKLAKNARVARGSGGGAGGGDGAGYGRAGNSGGSAAQVSGGVLAGSAAAMSVEVRADASPSSLQLTLENKQVKDTASDYTKQLSTIIAGKQNVIGYVFAINGKLNSGDVYASNALFKKLWPKMLEASAVEAIAEFKQDEKSEPVTAEAVKAFLSASEDGRADEQKVTPRIALIKRETEKDLFFETRDRKQGDAWVHRNYIRK
ncbi:MAG TPA: DUF6569 family protein [Blastocatellia bacterium]|nr:DUF6569 family protein [Blastocatellia bacterium]